METVRTVLRTILDGKTVILLNGARAEYRTGHAVDVQSPDKLLETARRNPDAVAFGFVARRDRWVASA
jgi:hypothetical protein